MSVEFYDRHSEAAVISCFVNDYADCYWMIDMLSPEDFYFGMARTMYQVIASLHHRGIPVDPVSVMGEASTDEIKEAFTKIVKTRHSVKKVRSYIDLLRAHRLRREAFKYALEMKEQLADFHSPEEIMGLFNKVAHDISSLGIMRDQACVDSRAIGAELLDRAKLALSGPPPEVVGIPSGIYELDQLTAGFFGGDIVVIAARPSMGKTALALNIANHVSQFAKEPAPVSIFSLEMSAKQLMQRMQASYAGVDMNKIRKLTLDESDYKKLESAHKNFRYENVIINDATALDIDEMVSILELQRREFKIELAIIDYVQLVSVSRQLQRNANRAESLGDITRKLKRAALNLDIPIIVLSQLNRGLESREDKRPLMSDLRESGAIEQDADTIMFIYRDIVYNKEADPTDAEIHVAKQRQGPIGTVNIRYEAATTTFRSRYGGGGVVGGTPQKIFSAGNSAGIVKDLSSSATSSPSPKKVKKGSRKSSSSRGRGADEVIPPL
ncbi:MAG: hypothetical protein CUN56_00635 [Phototrophicales bacterium]|nr:MAG: hypothetical protein CUN56_00635 [Phototrophicales bacterium]